MSISSRENILKVIKHAKKPLEVPFIVEKLGVNKTTVYRQIEKMLKEGSLIEVEFGDGKKRYELSSLGHHHHLICLKCGKVEEVEINEGKMLESLKKLKSNIRVERHSLEFFGKCIKC